MSTQDASSTVTLALTQARWTGDKESMIAKHEQLTRDAAAQGADIICFQELFNGLHNQAFCTVHRLSKARRAIPFPAVHPPI